MRLLLLDHANTSLRSPTPLPGETARSTYGVPLPVLRAVVSALRRRVAAAPLAALALADRLWQAGSLEERRIAAEVVALVAPSAPADVLRLVESWLPALSDADSADLLAGIACLPLLRADPAARLDDARRWLGDKSEWVRRFAVAAIAALAADKSFHDPGAVLAALRVVMADPSAEVRRGVVSALWAVAPKGPLDLAHFVQACSLESDQNTRWIVRHTLNGLSPKVQKQIEALIRTAP